MDSLYAAAGVKPSLGGNKAMFPARAIPRPRIAKCHAAQPRKDDNKPNPKNMSKREARNVEEASAPEGESKHLKNQLSLQLNKTRLLTRFPTP